MPQHEPSVVVMYLQPSTAQVVWEGYLSDIAITCIQTYNILLYNAGLEHMKPFVNSVADEFKKVALHGRQFFISTEG